MAISPSAQAPVASNAPASEDLGPLAWVNGEIQKSVETAVKSLRRVARETALPAEEAAGVLRIARQQLHQAAGVLQMVGQAAPARLVGAMERVVQSFIEDPASCTDERVSRIEKAGFGLSDFLGAALTGKRVSAVALFAQYREVLEMVRNERVHPADLWNYPWVWAEVQRPKGYSALAYGPDVRALFDRDILKVVKTGDEEAASKLSELCLSLGLGVSQPKIASFWMLASGFFEALGLSLLPADSYVKLGASRVLLQYTTLSRGDNSVSDRLGQDLLFFCAQAVPGPQDAAQMLRGVRVAWGLQNHEAINYNAVQFGRFDPAALAQGRKRIENAKEMWTALSSGATNRMRQVTDAFAQLGESLLKLHPASAPMVTALQNAVAASAESGKPPSTELAMEVATSVLYLEAAFEDLDPQDRQLTARTVQLAARIERARETGQSEPLEAWMEELYRKVSDRQTMGSIVDELRAHLAELEKSMDQFFRRPAEKGLLRSVPNQLQQMRGVFSVLGLDQASQTVQRMRDDVEGLLTQSAPSQPSDYDLLGNNLGALGFLIDMLGYQPGLARRLFVFDEVQGELKPLMGRQVEESQVHGIGADAGVAASSAVPLTDSVLSVEDVDKQIAAKLAALTPPKPARPAPAPKSAPPVHNWTSGLGVLDEMPATEVTELEEDDLQEIFLEEAAEVLTNGRAAVAALKEDAENTDELTVLRRAFHTLKGSSRMVGLMDFGDAAWAYEQVLNTWLADQRPATPELLTGASQALENFSQWVDAIAHRKPHDWVPAPFVAAAEALGRGEAAPAFSAKRLQDADALAVAARQIAADDVPVAAIAPEVTPVQDVAAPAFEPEPLAFDAPAAASELPAFDLELDAVPAQEAEPAAAAPAASLSELPDLDFEMEPLPLQTEEERRAEAEALDLHGDDFAITDILPAIEELPRAHSEPASLDLGEINFLDVTKSTSAPVPLSQPLDFTLPTDWKEERPAKSLSPQVPAAAEVPQELSPAMDDLDTLYELPAALEPEPTPAKAAPTPAPKGWEEELSIGNDDLDTVYDLPASVEPKPEFDAPVRAEARWDTELPPGSDDLDTLYELPTPVEPQAGSDTLARRDATWEDLPVGSDDLDTLYELPSAARAEPERRPMDDEDDELGLPLSADEVAASEWAELAGDDLPHEEPAAQIESLSIDVPAAEPETSRLELQPEPELAPARDFPTLTLDDEVPAVVPVEARALMAEASVEEPAANVEADAAEQPLPAPVLELAAEADLPPAEVAAAPVPEAEAHEPEAADEAETAETVDVPELADEAVVSAEAVDAIEAVAVDEAAAVAAEEVPPAAQDDAEVAEQAPTPVVTLASAEDTVKVIGSLRIGIPLYNVYLNEADEWSRQLANDVGEWALQPYETISDSTVGLAHSLAGSSATVGFQGLSGMSRLFEAALQHLRNHGLGDASVGATLVAAANEVRRLLHQFAAGFLKDPDPAVVQSLRELLLRTEEPTQAPAASEPALAGESMSFTTSAAPLRTDVDVPLEEGEEAIDVEDAVDPDLFPIFEEEAAELLPELGDALHHWSQHPNDAEHRTAALRTLHTLKGSARLAGAMRLGERAHRMESAIELISVDSADRAAVDELGSRYEALQATFEALRRADLAEQAEQAELAAAVVAAEPALPVSRFFEEPATAASIEAPDATPVDAGEAAVEDVAPALSTQAPSAPAKAAVPAAPLHPPATLRVTAARAGVGQTVRVRSNLLDRLVTQAGEVLITRSRLEVDIHQVNVQLNELTGNLDRLRQQLRDLEVQAESQMQSRLAQTKDTQQSFDPLEFDRFTRVQELTRIMAESVNDVATLQRTLQKTAQSAEDGLVAQARQTRELQRGLLRTRMVEFDSMADRLYRVTRQASKDTGKQVRLDITGGNIEMDRGVLERITPAFEHLLRNSVAHGVEDSETRVKLGKDPVGLVRVSLKQEGNDVSLSFSDDGYGLKRERILARARTLGLTDAEELTSAEAAELIFRPGFSTVSQLSEIAGRGVGMDVVRTEVVALGGRIETYSTDGQGTEFRLILPLTTAVTHVVMVRAGESTVGVPSNLVELVQRATTEELNRAYETQSYTFGGEEIPFYWSGALLQSSAASDGSSGRNTIVVVRSAAQRVAMHVDEVLGNQEVVVKNLGPQLARVPGMAGISVLASGAVALIYNPVALAALHGDTARALQQKSVEAAKAAAAAEAAGQAPVVTKAKSAASAVPLVLVVDDSITVRRVTQRLLQREGYRVALAADGLQALERLQEERPTLVLSDIEMPRMDGFDLARNIRADEALADLPIIMITSRIAEKHREHARELGVEHYLGKPYVEDELLALVRHFAAQAQAAEV